MQLDRCAGQASAACGKNNKHSLNLNVIESLIEVILKRWFMNGRITSYDQDTQTGVIKCGVAYFSFDKDVWKEEETPQVGDDVVFNQRKNKVLEVYLVGDYLPKGEPVKSRVIAGLLGIVLGGLGAGRFYLGFYKMGLLQLLVTVATLGYGLLWGLVDGVLILLGQVIKDAKGRPLK